MTVVADSSSSRARRRDPRTPRGRQTTPARLVVAGLLAALRASVTGLVLCLVAGLPLAWTGSGGPSVAGVVGIGGDLWLATHLVPLSFPHGPVSLLPLGLTLLPVALLLRAGRRLAGDVAVTGFRQAALAVVALAVPYACAGTLVAVSTLAATEHASLTWAPVATLLLALAAGGVGVLRGAGLGVRAAGLTPVWSRPTLVASAGAAAVLVACSALLVTAMLAVHVIRVREITASLHADGFAGVLLFLVGAVYVPNAVVFALGYAVGPGFSLGAGTVVAPWGYEGGPVPAFPVLAAVPAGEPSAFAWFVLAVPVLAGVAAGTLLVRHTLPRSLPRAALAGFAAGPVTGAFVALLTALGGGALGGGRLLEVGPPVLLTGLLAAGEVAVVAAATSVAASWLARRRTAATGDGLPRAGPPDNRPAPADMDLPPHE